MKKLVHVYGNNACKQVNKSFFAGAGRSRAIGNAIYTTKVQAKKGDVLVVSSSIQAIVGRIDFAVMVGTLISVSTKKPTKKKQKIKEFGKHIAPARATNIINGTHHYDLHTRHGSYLAPKDGTYYVTLVAYAASTGLPRDSSLGVGPKGCDQLVVRYSSEIASYH